MKISFSFNLFSGLLDPASQVRPTLLIQSNGIILSWFVLKMPQSIHFSSTTTCLLYSQHFPILLSLSLTII